MKVLVTGGNGFIGQHLCRRLLSDGQDVVVLDNFYGSRSKDIIRHPNLTFYGGSALLYSDVCDVMRDVDYVYHLACITGHLAVADYRKTYEGIVQGGCNVLRALGKRPAWLFSSSAALGKGNVDNANELRPLDGVSYDGGHFGYGAGKAEMERLALSSHANVTIVRPFNIVGVGQTGKYGMVLPSFVGRALLGLPITIYDDGSSTRNYGDPATFVDVLLKLAQHPREYTIYNIGSSEIISVKDLLLLVEEIVGPITRRHVSYASVFGKSDVKSRSVDMSRVESIIGPVSWPDIRTIVMDVVAWMRNLPSEDLHYFAGV